MASVLISGLFGLALALAASKSDGLTLFPPPHVGWLNAGLAFAFLIPTLATLPARWNWRTTEQKQRMLWRIPTRPSDLGWWAIVSLSAGITEEIIYRGAMLQLWERVVGSWWLAVSGCSIVFAIAHFVQGWRSMSIIFFLAIANHLIVRATGDLYTAMAIHVVYDFLAGTIFLVLVRREGLLPRQEEQPMDR